MQSAPKTHELGPFQLAVFLLSVFVLTALGLELVLPVDPEVGRIIGWIDYTVCAVLLVDFGIRFRKAESKLAFLKWGWVDLVASIPAIDALRFGRVLRVLRVLRVIRAARSIRALLGIVFESRVRGGAVSVATLTFLLVSISSVAILVAERGSGGHIDSAEDAVWWSIATITTVGYGDVFPITGAGRSIAAVLMIAGVGLFGTLSGAVASVFLGDSGADPKGAAERDDASPARLRDELHALHAEVAALRRELHEAPAATQRASSREPAE